MSTPINYYYGLKRGASLNPGGVVVGTSTSGSAVDVEIRVQVDNGTGTTGITLLDSVKLIEIIENFIMQRGITGSLGTNLPAN